MRIDTKEFGASDVSLLEHIVRLGPQVLVVLTDQRRHGPSMPRVRRSASDPAAHRFRINSDARGYSVRAKRTRGQGFAKSLVGHRRPGTFWDISKLARL